MGNARVSKITTEVITTGDSSGRVYQQYSEIINQGVGAARTYQDYLEVLAFSLAVARISQQYVEVITNIPSGGTTFDEEADNTLVLTQDATVTSRHDFQVSQTITFTQSAAHVSDVDADNTITFSGSAEFVKYINRAVTDTFVLDDDASVSIDYSREVSQGFDISHQATRTLYKACDVPQTLTLVQLAVGINTKKTSNTLTFVGLAEYSLGKRASSFLDIESVAEADVTYNRDTHTVFIPFQVLSVSTTINKTVAQSLILSQSAIGHRVKPIAQVLTLSQSVNVDKVRAATSTLTLAQSVTVSRTVNKSVQNTLALAQSLGLSKGYAIEAVSVLGFNQSAVGTRSVMVFAENTLLLTDELVQDYFDESPESILALNQEALGLKIASPVTESALTLSQEVMVSVSYSRTIEDTLVFKHSFNKYIGLPGQPFANIPEVQVTVVNRHCLTILQSGNSAIVLPCPEFGDLEAGTSNINIKRAMDGTRYVYKRTSPTNRLSYSFVIDRLKAKELRLFILNYNSSVLRLQNFKGELWSVVLTNNPFSFVEEGYWAEPRGNKCTITLEFEGVRLN
jgi:hypothetical protein